ncbi:uncharacterized protein B0P05DRAFT_536709 [Gilbertella persicaria]|uniref:uncharacterized protein n=1 Tax=Gilbertella persicaria TaxID=101096 RepID=UPI00221FB013|nr:uncharacterized protein B0P05DRAFT_536709 [Gilbertella persicaria]KAI8083257.1 hypothetical protein B0P05DRAFT_536709 [Gilbertella persicaria]
MSNQESSNFSNFSESETSPSLSDASIGYKRRRTNDTQVQPTDFLNLDYDFSNVMNPNQDFSLDTIPQDFLMFVSDSNDTTVGDYQPSRPLDAPIPQVTSLPLHPQGFSTDSSLFVPPQPPQPPPTQTKKPIVDTYRQDDDPPNQAVHTIVSDGPTNFFVEYFRRKKTKVMHIDRDPDSFELIVRHLRGYYIQPTEDIQNQSLLYDAQYYGLKRLQKTLQEYLFLNVGGRVFRLPWELFKKDGANNFFTGPLKHSLLSPHTANDGTAPPIYIDRDPDIFEDIVNHLRGYTIHIRDEMHRKNLLRDAQYYALRQLNDKLLTAQQTVAGFGEGANPEVLLLLQDIRAVNVLPPKATQPYLLSEMHRPQDWSQTQLQYKRFTDSPVHALLVQVADMTIYIHKTQHLRLLFDMHELDMQKMRSIAKTIKASSVNQEIYLDSYCAITIDDHHQVQSLQYCLDHDMIETRWKECTQCTDCQVSQFMLHRAICGIHLINGMVSLNALRLEAIGSRFKLNLKRQFLK